MPRSIFLVLMLVTLVRVALAVSHDISPEEAHLWVCAQRPALWYFHFGPAAPLVVKLGDLVAGPSALAVRWASPWLGLVMSLMGYRLASGLFDPRAGAWTVVVINLTPLFNLGTIVFSPETLALTAWMAALWFLWRALHRASPWDVHWAMAGACMGLGVLSAPFVLLQPAGLILLSLFDRRWRGRLHRPGPWIAVTIPLLCALPMWFWHAAQDSLALRAQWMSLTGRLQSTALPAALGKVTVALSPFLAAGFIWALWHGLRDVVQRWRRGSTDRDVSAESTLFLLAFGLPSLVFAGWVALAGGHFLGVAAPGLLALTLLLVGRWMRSDLAPATTRLAQHATLAVAAAYSIALVQSDLIRGWGLPWPHRYDPTVDWRGWTATADGVRGAVQTLERQPNPPTFIIAASPALASALNFHLAAGPPLASSLSPAVQPLHDVLPSSDYAFWSRFDAGDPASSGQRPALWGASALFVTGFRVAPAPPRSLVRSFESVVPLGDFTVLVGGDRVRQLALFACSGYRGPSF